MQSFGDPDRKNTLSRNKLMREARKGKKTIEINSLEERIAAEIILPGEIDVKLDSIGGLNDEKEELYDLVILPLKRPELFAQKGLACMLHIFTSFRTYCISERMRELL